MKILITGAAGKLGRALRQELAAAGHALRLVDVRPIENPEGEPMRLDIADGDAVLRAMESMEGVAHLAFGWGVTGNPLEHISRNFDVNTKATHVLLWAAQRHGVRRFVYTSTLSVFGHTSELGREFWNERSRPEPDEVYGLSKYLGEESCRFFATRFGLSVAVLRLCNLADDALWREAQESVPRNNTSKYWRAMATHVSDVARAIHLALTVPGLRFEIIHIAADNAGRLTDIQKAKDVLGFWPRLRLDEPAVKTTFS